MAYLQPAVSVVLCTYNPRADLLRWALLSIGRQTLAKTQFELIVVDNRSTLPLERPALETTAGMSVRLLREERQGLTYARMAGIRAAAAKLLVFVDDDNFLNEDYLERALEIAADNPWIGCFGGKTRAVLEAHVPAWKQRLLDYLGVRDYGPHPITSNNTQWGHWEPIGAGMVCRRDVAEEFVRWVEDAPVATRLGRSGTSLMSGEDTLIAQAAYRLNYSCSYQPALQLAHWMKAPRLSSIVLARTLAGHGSSHVILQQLRGSPVPRPALATIAYDLPRRYLGRVRTQGLGKGSIEWFWDVGYYREARRQME